MASPSTFGLVARMTSSTPSRRSIRPSIASWSGPMPRCGESVPPQRRGRGRGYSPVRSIGWMLNGSSTTQMRARSRCGSVQSAHGSTAVMALHVRAVEELLLDLEDRLGEPARRSSWDLEQVVREPRRRLRADARQSRAARRSAAQRIGHRARSRLRCARRQPPEHAGQAAGHARRSCSAPPRRPCARPR